MIDVKLVTTTLANYKRFVIYGSIIKWLNIMTLCFVSRFEIIHAFTLI